MSLNISFDNVNLKDTVKMFENIIDYGTVEPNLMQQASQYVDP